MLDVKASQIKDLYYANYRYFFSKPNVVGIAYGYKMINGMNTYEPCIHVLVEKKVPANCLSNNEMIPPIYQGVKTDVIETGIFTSGNNPCKCNCSNSLPPPTNPYVGKIRPIQAGWSISTNFDRRPNLGKTSTIGYWGTDRSQVSKTYCILSTASALSDLNRYPIGGPILQPSFAFGGRVPNDVVGSLLRFIPLNLVEIFDPDPPLDQMNVVDAALASYVSTGEINLINPFIPPNGIWLNGLTEPQLGMNAALTSCSYGQTISTVTSLNAIVKTVATTVEFAWFKDLTLLNPEEVFANDNSLGSLVTTYPPIGRQAKALGLFCAIASSGFNFGFCSIQKIQELLNFSLLVAP